MADIEDEVVGRGRFALTVRQARVTIAECRLLHREKLCPACNELVAAIAALEAGGE